MFRRLGPHAELAQILNDEIVLYSKRKLNIVQLENNCIGDFKSVGFYNSCLRKTQNIIEYLLKLDTNDYLIYLDSDICIKNDVVSIMIEELGQYDLAFQQDSPNVYCAGMFICRKNEKTLQLFQDILDRLVTKSEYYQNQVCDQTVLNEILETKSISYKALSERFTTYGNIGNGEVWESDCAPFKLPENLVAFHANFTIGIHNKKLLLNTVRYTK